ncbi:response regulator receiver modulated diguanylate cyclase [Thiorhodococcus drewsii AZ1]|uniref:diguanylate cyclase n=2 Tax=Thiorhodococcus drewsii TaxID=210408 RepID=G2E2I8_9GAMM|nr:response regulator receiver modulated diguanylate cyclase [Thiorhodococcus drewsii AZ1]
MEAQFLKELPTLLYELEAAWSHALEPASPPSALDGFIHRAHSLAGTSGTLGQPALGRHTKEIECLAERLRQTEGPVRSELAARISARIRMLKPQSPQVAEGQETAEEDGAALSGSSRTKTADGQAPCLLLIENDPRVAAELSEQLGHFGWDVVRCARTQLDRMLDARRPVAIISDEILTEGHSSDPRLGPSTQRLATHTPVIIVSDRWDWDSRLAAVRTGADAYLTRPLDIHRLADLLDKLTGEQPQDAYRVLILDDEARSGDYYAEVLRGAGMHAVAISEPRRLLDSLNEVNPELILMDLHMPDCNGIEAARIVRQDERYASVPIVFLSGESDRQRQLSAMGTGADDFLTKPIGDTYLVSAVELRIARFRSLTALIRQDSLTGLLNRIAFDLQVEAETSRASRSGSPLVLAMLDIDHFKRINDTYGHPVGDRVIKSLAQLLRKRLRRYDIIGRYGGEEFTILMPDTPLAAAEKVLNELREQFSLLHLSSVGDQFHCTFSAGLAALDDHPSQELTAVADAALYEAKRLGRNRVVCADTGIG